MPYCKAQVPDTWNDCGSVPRYNSSIGCAGARKRLGVGARGSLESPTDIKRTVPNEAPEGLMTDLQVLTYAAFVLGGRSERRRDTDQGGSDLSEA